MKNVQYALSKLSNHRVQALVSRKKAGVKIIANNMNKYRDSFKLWKSINSSAKIYQKALSMEHFMERLTKLQARNMGVILSKKLFKFP